MENKETIIVTEGNSVECYPTANLRYVKRKMSIDGVHEWTERRLQQMWQYSDGRTQWKWVDSLSESFVDEESF